jgi:hypothetical protein
MIRRVQKKERVQKTRECREAEILYSAITEPRRGGWSLETVQDGH